MGGEVQREQVMSVFAGEVLCFINGKDDAETDGCALIELTDWSKAPFIEIAADVGKRRVYFKFRVEDLLRAIDEERK
jgi:hypothetical protein